MRSKAYLLFMINYANKFKPFNIDDGKFFSQEKLFKEYDTPENVLAKCTLFSLTNNYKNENQYNFVNLTNKSQRQSDMSKMLESSRGFEDYFITNGMKDLYFIDKNTKDEILLLRKQLIVDAEENFVRSLKIIDYTK